MNGRVDLKKGGLLPLFTSARVLSIRHGVRARSTPERFRGVAAAGIGSTAEIEAIIAAHRLLLGIILDQQLADAEAGIPLSPKVDIARLGKTAREELRAALGQRALGHRSGRRGKVLRRAQSRPAGAASVSP